MEITTQRDKKTNNQIDTHTIHGPTRLYNQPQAKITKCGMVVSLKNSI